MTANGDFLLQSPRATARTQSLHAQPLADMIVRTANAVKERILHDPRIKATEAIEIGDVIESKTKMITVENIRHFNHGTNVFDGNTIDEPKEYCCIDALEVEYINGRKVP